MTDPERARLRRRRQLQRRKPLEQRTELQSRTPLARSGRLRAVSDKRRAENELRRAVVLEAFGPNPRCALCGPLAERGVTTGCNGWADDVDEVMRRSAGGSIVDVENLRPVGRSCHRWATEHPAELRAWGLERSRYGGDR